MNASLRIWPCKCFAVGLVLLAIGCNRGANAPRAGEPIIAFVAASTKDAVQEIAHIFTSETKVPVKINAEDSSKLATQITYEAPAQLFLSANEKWAAFVNEKGFAHQTIQLLGNKLVIVTPKGNPAAIRRAEDLTKASLQRLAVGGPTVPAGIYAREALKGIKLWETLEANKKIVSADNVRVALTYVERGETEAGIVYATDAKISEKVELVYTFPEETHEPIRYPLVLLKSGNASPAARWFFEFLQSAKAKDVFAKHGFIPLVTK
jgi:molybdate transport system substrate-binding protein